MKKIIAFFFLALGLFPAFAQVWQPMPLRNQNHINAGLTGGEGGQWCTALARDGQTGDFLLYGTDVGGIWRSLDGGANWSPCNVGFSARGVCDFAIDPNNPDRCLAIGGNSAPDFGNAVHGIYLSTDKGRSWALKKSASICGTGDLKDVREQLAFDAATFNPDANLTSVAYWCQTDLNSCSGNTANPDPGIYKTTDGGNNWFLLPGSSQFGNCIIKIHPTSGTVLVSNESGFYVSSDGGMTFSQTFTGKVQGMDLCLSQPNRVYLLTENTLYKSEDIGANFEAVPGILPAGNGNVNLQHLSISPANSDNMMLNTTPIWYDIRQFFSNDGGLTWTQTTYPGLEPYSNPASLNYLPLNSTRLGDVAWHPFKENELVGFGCDGILKSTDSGASMQWWNNGNTGVLVGGKFAISSTNPAVIIFPTQDYDVSISIDQGSTWKYLNMSGNGWGGFFYGAYSPDGQTIVAAQADYWHGPRTIARSFDGGNTIEETAISVAGQPIGYGSPTNDSIFFLGNQRTTDKGQHWATMDNCTGVFCHNTSGIKALYGTNNEKIVRSTDEGYTWNTLAVLPDWIEDLAFDPVGNVLYAACEDANFYKIDAEDGLFTSLWSKVPADQFGNKRFNTVSTDPVSGTVYLGSHRDIYATDKAMLRSSDNGETWEILTGATETDGGREATCVRVNPVTRDVLTATSCYGFWKWSPAPDTVSVGIADLAKIRLRIYPNPVSETITVEMYNLPVVSADIFDAMGKLIFRKLYSNQWQRYEVEKLPVEHLMQGVYVLKIGLENGTKLSARFLKM